MEKALLISDDNELLELQKNTLSNRNIRLFTASSESEAIKIHSRENVNLVVCGLNMSPEACSSFCSRMRREDRLKDVSIIMMVSNGSVKEIEDCIRAGANDYISDPLEPVDLLQKAAKYVNMATRMDKRVGVRLAIEGRLPDGAFVGFTLNLSASGFLMEADHKFLIGETMVYSLSLPGTERSINVTGRVVRKSVGRHPYLYLYGIKIIEINSDDKRLIEEALERTAAVQGKEEQGVLF